MSGSIQQAEKLQRTPLFEVHKALGARMAPFGGFEMPIQYAGIIKEHLAARQAAAIFDTCHMGEFRIDGPRAVADLERLLTCSVGSMKTGQCRYGFLCNESGGVIDDQILYRISDTEFLMVVNASTQETDLKWIASHISQDTVHENLSDRTAKIDLQGPASPALMNKIMKEPVDGMRYFRFRHNSYKGTRILVSRTGYTGEIGFEIYCDPDCAERLFNDSISLGATPAGLGARDTLRLEMGMPLYGHELDEDRSPVQTGMERAIDGSKEFIGSAKALAPDNALVTLAGIRLDSRRAARARDTVWGADGERIGIVTSGSYSPSLTTAIALGYLRRECAQPGTKVYIATAQARLEGAVVELPFYRTATGRRKLEQFL